MNYKIMVIILALFLLVACSVTDSEEYKDYQAKAELQELKCEALLEEIDNVKNRIDNETDKKLALKREVLNLERLVNVYQLSFYGDEILDESYTNYDYRFSIKLPSNWVYTDVTERDPNALFYLIATESEIDGMNTQNGIISIKGEVDSTKTQSLDLLSESIMKQFMEDESYEELNMEALRIGNSEFTRFTGKLVIEDTRLEMETICTLIDDALITMSVTYMVDSEVYHEIFEDLVNSFEELPEVTIQ